LDKTLLILIDSNAEWIL